MAFPRQACDHDVAVVHESGRSDTRRVFVSYSTHDSDVAERIVAAIGADPSFDVLPIGELGLGADSFEAVGARFGASDIVLVLVSMAAANSDSVQLETTLAVAKHASEGTPPVRVLLDGDDLEEAALEADRTASESDRESSEGDRLLSEADQRASDRDQAVADRGARGEHIPDLDVQREVSRTERAGASAARARIALIRADTGARRFAAAERRAEGRGRARVAREAQQLALAEAELDDLTGTYRRTRGYAELQAEVDRAHRSGGRLVLAFVDVDELKAHNDLEGHAAGDELLLNVVSSIRSRLRSYDPVMRYGGDEFICALSDADLNNARNRFARIQTALEQTHPGGSISVGLAQMRAGETLEKLMARGDIALREAKNRR